MLEAGEKQEKLTFYSKAALVCPVCEQEFHREDLLSGRGRLIAGDLTLELRRQYLPSRKYGEVYPLVYAVTVCPSCLYAALPQDFSEAHGDTVEGIKAEAEKRGQTVALVVEDLDFGRQRTLNEGVASYLLALMCYEHFPAKAAPTFKRGLSALRCAWCLNDLHAKYPGENYDYLARLLYRKARFFYGYALELMQSRREDIEGVRHYGPDLDNNFGYDGFLYIAAFLEYSYGPRQDPEKRLAALEQSKRVVAKIFGSGKASKGKPSAILELAREVYEKMSAEIKSLQGE